MGFFHPEVLWLFAALVPLAMAWNFVAKRRERQLARFAVRDNWTLLNRSVSRRARFHKAILILFALSFATIAAARPWWGTRERTVQRRGTNIIYAFDVSQSMRATDVAPDRMEYARSILRQTLLQTPGNRVGVMPFAGEAFLQCPLTTDYGVALDVVRQVSHDAVAFPGTDFRALVDAAIEAFERSGAGSRILVVLTDGEDHSQQLVEAAENARDNDIVVYAMGIGTIEGAPIRLADGTLKEAADGTKVLSRLEPEILRTLADITGGRSYMADTTGRVDPEPLIRDLNSIAREDLGEDRRIVREERFQWPLALALLCLMIESLIGERRRVSISAVTDGASTAARRKTS